MQRFGLGAFLAIALLPYVPQVVFAHATPTEYQPFASAILEKAPESVRIRFTEHIEPGPSSLKVLAPDGNPISEKDAVVNSGNPHLYQVAIQDGGQGTYIVVWRVISADDGHFTSGAYTFSVGTPTTPVVSIPSGIEYHTTFLETLFVWLELLGQALAVGGLAILFVILLPLKTEALYKRKLRAILIFAASAIFLGALLYVIERTASIAGAQEMPFIDSFRIFAGTYPGMFALARSILGLLLFIILLTRRSLPSSLWTWGGVLLTLTATLTVLGRAIMSHAFASHFYPFFSVGVNFLHLIAKETWIGGIVVLATLFSLKTRESQALRIAASFTKIAAYALGIGGVTGTYIIWLHLKGFSQAFTTTWGQLCVLMTIIAAFFLGMRLLEQRKEHAALRDEKQKWKPTLLIAEASLGVLILILTSRLILTTPPLHALEPFLKAMETQGVAVSLREASNDPNSFELAVTSSEVGKVTLAGNNIDKGVGPIVIEPPEQDGVYRFSKDAFAVPGNWNLEFTIQRFAGYDLTGNFSLHYPDDLQLKRGDETPRQFGLFEISMLFASAGLLIGSVIMYRSRPHHDITSLST